MFGGPPVSRLKMAQMFAKSAAKWKSGEPTLPVMVSEVTTTKKIAHFL
jgi:hypothetical protein